MEKIGNTPYNRVIDYFLLMGQLEASVTLNTMTASAAYNNADISSLIFNGILSLVALGSFAYSNLKAVSRYNKIKGLEKELEEMPGSVWL